VHIIDGDGSPLGEDEGVQRLFDGTYEPGRGWYSAM